MPLPGLQQQLPQPQTTNLTSQKGWLERFKNFLGGSPDEFLQISQHTPGQMQNLDQLLSMAMQGIQKTPFNFNDIANQTRTDFAQNTLPSIAQRFSAMGSGNQGSSAFKNSVAGAYAGLDQGLAGLQGQYNLSQQSNLMNLLSMGLAPRYQQSFLPGNMGLLGGFAQGAGQGLGSLGAPFGQWYFNTNNAAKPKA